MIDKERMTRRYRDFYNWLLGYLDGADPIRLMGDGNPGLEYAPEAARIVPLLRTATSKDDLAIQIHQVFVECFGDNDAGQPTRYKDIAAAIYCRWHAEHETGG